MLQQVFFILLPLAFVNSGQPEGTIWEVSKSTDDYLDDRPFLGRDSLLETHLITGHSDRKPLKKEKRESTYHVLISPGLKSYFDFNHPGEETYNEVHVPAPHHLKRRSIETMDETPKNDIEIKTNLNSSQSENYTNLNAPKQSAREARGATKEQWIQQAYPVDFHAPKENNDQRSSTANDEANVRAPRVHFVTQKRLDASETQDRAQVASRVSPADPPRNIRPYEQPHRARSLENYDYRSRAYDSPNGVRDYRDYNLQRDYSRYDDRYNPLPTTEYDPGYSRAQKKQQRIIYYATLPDVIRSPPNVDLRYRSPDLPLPPNYFNRQDDRFVTSPTVSISDNSLYYDKEGRYDIPSTYSYRQPPYYGSYSGYPSRHDYSRNPYRASPNLVRRTASADDYRTPSRSSSTTSNTNNRNNDKNRPSDNNGDRVAPYPVKISTGVNVKESDRKIPERRIYADRDREYVYAPPSFQTADDDSVGFESRY